MKPQQDPKQLQEQWEQAVERAGLPLPRTEELGQMLVEAEGVLIKTGLRGGGLTPRPTATCHRTPCPC